MKSKVYKLENRKSSYLCKCYEPIIRGIQKAPLRDYKIIASFFNVVEYKIKSFCVYRQGCGWEGLVRSVLNHNYFQEFKCLVINLTKDFYGENYKHQKNNGRLTREWHNLALSESGRLLSNCP